MIIEAKDFLNHFPIIKSSTYSFKKLNYVLRLRHIFLFFFNYSYGLLGASGCGKTTVLSTIVGLKTLNQGIVSVFGGIPGDRKLGIPGNRVGYMPQVNKS